MKLSDAQKNKVEMFANDEEMSNAVYTVLLNAYLAPPPPSADTNILAASRIAIDMLPEAWKEIRKYAQRKKEEKVESVQIGL